MELVFDFFLVALFSSFLFMSRNITSKTIASDQLGSKGFPQMIAIVAIILLIAIVIKTIIAMRKTEPVKGKTAKITTSTKTLYKRVVLLITLLFLYIVFLKKIGFTLETLLFIFLSLTILGYKNYRVSIIFSIAFTAMLVIVFGRVFFIAIPRGTGLLKELSYFLY